MALSEEEKRQRKNAYMRERHARRMEEDPEGLRKEKREWAAKDRQANPEHYKGVYKVYREKHKEKAYARTREWFAKHPDYVTEYRLKRIEAHMIKIARSRAKQNGIPFSLTENDIQISERCPVLGIPLDKAAKKGEPNSVTLDRVIPALGYVPGNVRVISCRANRLKSDATLEELEAIIAYIRRETS